jgi:nicotinamidase-related amidase
MPEKALIIVDMLNDFIDPRGVLYCGDTVRDIMPVIRRELELARRQGDLVIYLQDSHAKDDLEFEKFPPHCITGTWGGRIVDALAPREGETVIAKRRYSGFYETDLATLLADTGVKEVTVVGVCTSICVMDTVGGLANRDYKAVVPQAGVADFDQEMHQMALRRMKTVYGAEIT